MINYKMVVFQEERSPVQNKKIALARLQAELYKRKFEQEMSVITKSRKSQIGNMNRNEKIRTYNYSRNTITDHRLGKSKQIPSLDLFLQGSFGFEVLDMFKEKLQKTEDIECLKEIIENVK